MNIIERTQYSADGGKTWAVDEDSARAYATHPRLAEHVGTQRAGYILDAIRQHPDALIQAMRDMGALPADGGWAAQRGYRDALAYAADNGAFHLYDVTYAVIPVEQHEKGKSAIQQVKAFARGEVSMAYSREWCDANGINWRDN